jgi:hypothetical protein
VTEQKKTSVFDRTLSVLAFIIALVALLLSCQANQISEHQITPQVIVLNATFINGIGSYPNENHVSHAGCQYRIRITNLGGAATSLVGFSATISYRGKKIELDGEDFYAVNDTRALTPSLSSFFAVLLDKGGALNLENAYLQQDKLGMPAKLDAYSALDIDAGIAFEINGNTTLTSADPQQPRDSDMQVDFILKTSSGQKVASPDVSCWDIRE